MNERELQEIVQKYGSNFKILIENNSFVIDEIKMFQTDLLKTLKTCLWGWL